MIRIAIMLILVGFTTSIFAQSKDDYGQSDANAVAILEKSKAKYEALSDFTIDFSIIVDFPDEDVNEIQKGNAVVKNDAFYLKMGEQEIICDGNNLWTYIAEVNEAQVSEFIESDDMFTPNKIFTSYDNSYLYRLRDTKTVNGKSCYLVELTPYDKDQTFFKIILSIEKSTSQILQSTVFDKSGIKYTYQIDSFKSNTGVPSSKFTFDQTKYEGVTITDLR